MSIYILTVRDIEEGDSFFLPFSTEQKAQDFIKNNFNYDTPRLITKELFEGKNNHYAITSPMVDQLTM